MLFKANFDFESRITPTANGRGVLLPQAVRDRMSPLAGLFSLLADECDLIGIDGYRPPTVEIIDHADPGDPADDLPSQPPGRIVEWTFEDALPELTADLVEGVTWWGQVPDGPTHRRPRHLIQTLTDRTAWAERLPRLGFDDWCGTPTLACRHRSDIRDALSSDEPVMLKAAFSAFGRGCRPSNENPATLDAWIDRCLKHGGLTVEPLYEVIEEKASHFVISDQAVEWLGSSRLHVDGTGRTIAVEPHRLIDRRHDLSLSAAVRTVVEHVRSIGYVGPFSIDHARARYRELDRWRLFQDINPRLTLGSLALRGARRFGRHVAIALVEDWSPAWPVVREWRFRGTATKASRESVARVLFGPRDDFGRALDPASG